MENMGIWGTVLYFALIIGIIYFLLIRPQRQRTKKHQEMVGNLAMGVEVVTIGGIHGEVTRLKDETVWLRVSNNVDIEVDKSAIGRVVS